MVVNTDSSNARRIKGGIALGSFRTHCTVRLIASLPVPGYGYVRLHLANIICRVTYAELPASSHVIMRR